MGRRAFRIAATVLLAVGVVTCADAPTGPGRGGGAAHLRIVPSFDAGGTRALSALAAFQESVASVRIQIQRPPDESLVDTSIVFPPGADSVVLALTVHLQATSEQLQADVQLRDAAGTILFEGRSTITATEGVAAAPAAAAVRLSYVGPGSGTASLLVSPQAFTTSAGRQAQFTFSALDSSGKPVNNVPVSWSSSSASVATVDVATGLATAVAAGTTIVSVKALNGISATATLTVVNPPSKLQVVSGNAQKAPAGSATPQPFTVLVTNVDGVAVPNVPVTFRALDAAASVTPTSALTDANGRASATATLGTKSGAYAFEASVTGLAAARVTDTATAGAAAQIAIVSGNAQSDTAGKALPQPLVVKATDKYGNAVPEAGVTWSHTGGGAVSATNTTSDSAGLASVTYTLGAKASTDTVRAQLDRVNGAAGTAVFVETGSPRAPAALAIVSGNAQAGAVGSVLPTALVVEVRDDHGTPVAGAAVLWTVSSGTGALSTTRSVADSLGRAAVTLTPGRVAGAIAVTATIDGTSIRATFSEAGIAGAAGAMVKQAGDGQTAAVGAAVSIAPSVKVTDSFGNVVSGVPVAFAVVSGGGTVTGPSQTTDGNGIAAVGSWTLGTTAGPNTLRASAGVLSVTFAATAQTGPLHHLGMVTQPSAAATSGVVLSTQPSVRLQDQYNNAIATAGVQIVATVSGGSSAVASHDTATTDATGLATFSGLTVTGTPGTFTLTFQTPAALSATSIAVTLSAGKPASIAAVAGAATADTAGAQIAAAALPAVIVKDASGNPVPGVAVSFSSDVASSVSTDGATFGSGPFTATTNVAGVAALMGWHFGTAVATTQVSASVAGLAGSPVLFSASIAPASAHELHFDAQPSSAVSLTPISTSVSVRDRFNNVITTGTGSADTISIALAGNAGGAVLTAASGSLRTKASAGVASFSATVDKAGVYALVAKATGRDTALSANFTISAATAKHTDVLSGNGQSGSPGSALAQPLSVHVIDASGNSVSGARVAFAVDSGGGTVGGAMADTISTDASGNAAVSWTLGASGAQRVHANVPGAGAGDTAVFHATLPAVLASLSIVQEPDATPQSGEFFGTQPQVQLVDANGAPLAQGGVSVTASIAAAGIVAASRSPAPGPSLSRAALRAPGGPSRAAAIPVPTLIGTLTETTDATGRATFSRLGAAGLANSPFTITFSSGSFAVTSSSVSLLPGRAKHVSKAGTDSQFVAFAHRARTRPVVVVRDSVGNAIPNASVSFTVDNGGALDSPNAASDANGNATAPGWTVGRSAGANHLLATISGADTATFTAFGMKPKKLVLTRGPGGTHQSGNVLAQQPALAVEDSLGNQLDFDMVSVSVHPRVHGTSGFATVAVRGDTTHQSDTTGAVAYSAVALHAVAGTTVDLVFTASSSDTSVHVDSLPWTNGIVVSAGPAASMSSHGASYHVKASGAAHKDTASVSVVDGSLFQNPVSGTTVTFSRSGSLCSGADTVVTTDAGGNAVLELSMSSASASCQVTASNGTLAGSGIRQRYYAAPSGSNVWTGGASHAWSNGANWSNGAAPDAATDVFIPQYADSVPQLDGAASTRALRVESGSALDLHGNALTVSGDADVNGAVASSVAGSQVSVTALTAAVHGTFSTLLSLGSGSCDGSLTLTGATVADSVLANCPVSVGANSLTSSHWLHTAGSGAVYLNDPAGLVTATDVDLSGGQSSLTNGTFIATGNVNIGSAGLATDTLNTLELAGTAPVTLSIQNPSATSFGQLEIDNTNSGGVGLSVPSGSAFNVNKELRLGDNVSFTIPLNVTLNAKNVKLGNNATLTVNGSVGNPAACVAASGQVKVHKPASCP